MHLGFLVPTGGGEDIPLKKERILIGRRENCAQILGVPVANPGSLMDPGSIILGFDGVFSQPTSV